jgi:hypothetical protein
MYCVCAPDPQVYSVHVAPPWMAEYASQASSAPVAEQFVPDPPLPTALQSAVQSSNVCPSPFWWRTHDPGEHEMQLAPPEPQAPAFCEP